MLIRFEEQSGRPESTGGLGVIAEATAQERSDDGSNQRADHIALAAQLVQIDKLRVSPAHMTAGRLLVASDVIAAMLAEAAATANTAPLPWRYPRRHRP